MFWTLMAIAGGLAAVTVAAAVVIARHAKRRVSASVRIAAGAGHGSLYGFTSEDEARFHRSARDQMHRHQAQWSRDYLSGITDKALPGRVAGIPRALRVRR